MNISPLKINVFLVFLLILSSLFVTSSLKAKDPAKIISGWVEKVRIDNQKFEVKAKLDTGARTSSIHAKDIKSYKKDDQRWVKFTLVLTDNKDKVHELQMDKPRSRKTKIKNHDGVHDKRYVVDFDICFNGQMYTTEFTLADRSEYIYDILLGRQFLKKVAVVDSNQIFLTTATCE